MIKRAVLASVAVLLVAAGAAADWRTDLRGFLDPPRRDFAGARAYLNEGFEKLDPENKPTAAALLAFFAAKTGDQTAELERVVFGFETYGDLDPSLDILDDALTREFMVYWGRWKTAYPLASGFVLLEPTDTTDQSPPAEIEVGLDLLNAAFFRVSDPGGTLTGGLWQGGFHILRLPFSAGYDKTGELAFDLDLKAGDLVVRKRISLRVDVRSSAAYSLPPVEAVSPAAKNAPPPPRPVAGEVSLYVGDKLILKSNKLSSKPPPLKITIPGPSPWGTKPYMAPRKDDPRLNQVSILDAVSLAIQAIKDLGKKRKEARTPPPAYRKSQAFAYAFSRPGPSGGELRYQASVSLSAASGTVASDRASRTL